MVNVTKHVAHWLEGAEESWKDADALLREGRWTFGAYSAHLALEKILKAHVTKATREIPPRIHDLTRLANLASLELTSVQRDLLELMNRYQLEGRYRDVDTATPDPKNVRMDVDGAKDLYLCLKEQL